MNSFTEPIVQSVINKAVNDYFDGCRGRIDGFIVRHFRYPGAWHNNKPGFGWDLLRAPFNLFWAPVYLLSVLLARVSRRLGWRQLSNLLAQVPEGLTTTVQIHIAERIYTDLLQCTDSTDKPNQLQEAIAKAFDDLVEPDVHNKEMLRELAPVIAEALSQYGLTRTASADITNSLVSTVVGAFAFQKFTPGGIAVGLLIASWLAQKQAIESFIFGEFLGGLYYRLFPVDPTLGWNLLGIALVLCCLAIFALFSGLLTDPVQSWTGLHKNRLNKMIDHLQKDFEAESSSTFRPKDSWLARILEILDAAKSQLV